jgi:hypothetical protein
MLMINESSLSTVEIGLDSDFKVFYIRKEKRQKRKERNERERELKCEKWTLPTLRQRRERERE